MAVNAVSAITPASRTASRILRALALRPWGRFLVIALGGGLAIGLGPRDEALRSLGFGLIPAAGWAGAFLLIFLHSPRAVVRRWRTVLASLILTAAVVGAMGMIDAPPQTVFQDITLAGIAGEAIARLPTGWAAGDATPFQLALAALRVTIIALLAAAVVLPKHARVAAERLGAGAAALYARALAGAADLQRRLDEFAERRRAAAEAAALAEPASAPSEAELLESPSYQVEQAAPEIRGVFLEEEPTAEAAAPPALPAPSKEDLWTDEEAAAVAALLSAAQVAVGTAPGEAGAAAAQEAGATLAVSPQFEWKLPPLSLLLPGRSGGVTKAEVQATSDLIVETLVQHGVDVSVDQIRTGPTVTMYGLAPGWGGARAGDAHTNGARGNKRVRVDTILAREKDLALALASPSLRFEAPIPGASLVGIEVPNANASTVTLRSVMETGAFEEFEKSAALPVALGVASAGESVLADLAKMPHLLVAGATGSGKSVSINSIITGLLMVRTPPQLRIVLIDPKRVELTPYAGVPHLACPPVVEADEAVAVLKAAVVEMMERFQVLERAGTKNIAAYNEKAATRMPYLVIAVDELADLMLNASNEVERLLVRLAQLGRATGVHLVVATQRPSVDVVTGLIKANFPSRISFSVSSQVDSRTIIDGPGAEKLLGKGDMLFLPIDRAKPMRVQGAFLTDAEVEAVVNRWRAAGGPPMPQLSIPRESSDGEVGKHGPSAGTGDALFNQALELARTQSRLSTSLLQRRLRIGYPRAARLMDELEDAGVVGPGEPGKPRVVIGN